MSETRDEVKLQDGTLIRHRIVGYEGRIDGTTGLKICFTQGGTSLGNAPTKQTFQYRVLIEGENMRRIAPIEDLEILEGAADIVCSKCQAAFRTKPGHANKPAGRCQCGGWICPFCLTCQSTASCAKQRLRLIRKLNPKKKAKSM